MTETLLGKTAHPKTIKRQRRRERDPEYLDSLHRAPRYSFTMADVDRILGIAKPEDRRRK